MGAGAVHANTFGGLRRRRSSKSKEPVDECQRVVDEDCARWDGVLG
jgi:hypothetical protein